MESPRTHRINNCMKESSFSLLNAICIGSVLMLLHNFIVEYSLMNGSIGIVHGIVYMEHDGPYNQKALTIYVVVEFKESSILNEKNDGRPTFNFYSNSYRN